MPSVFLRPETSLVVLVDMQPSFLKAIYEAERVERRCQFTVEIASVLGIPVIATEQNPERMGRTIEALMPFTAPPIPKMTFSCTGSSAFLDAVRETGRHQIVIVGIETHICVSQTALGLLRDSFEVVVCPDAVSARDLERHKLGMERIRDGGIVPAHSEAIAYEWLQSANHPKFREALAVVKKY